MVFSHVGILYFLIYYICLTALHSSLIFSIKACKLINYNTHIVKEWSRGSEPVGHVTSYKKQSNCPLPFLKSLNLKKILTKSQLQHKLTADIFCVTLSLFPWPTNHLAADQIYCVTLCRETDHQAENKNWTVMFESVFETAEMKQWISQSHNLASVSTNLQRHTWISATGWRSAFTHKTFSKKYFHLQDSINQSINQSGVICLALFIHVNITRNAS